ncbi:MAG: hypothetical protein ACK4MM_00610 [Fervidobacterium sp.]
MSNEKQSRSMSKIVKAFAHEFNYNPGPIMEEKIVRRIKRQKIKRILYRVGVFLIIFVVLLIGSEKIVLEKSTRQNAFSLQWFFGKNNQVKNLNTDLNVMDDKQSNDFKLIINNEMVKNLFELNYENYEKEGIQVLNENKTLVLERELEKGKTENGTEDNLFKMLKYVSIANDGDW